MLDHRAHPGDPAALARAPGTHFGDGVALPGRLRRHRGGGVSQFAVDHGLPWLLALLLAGLVVVPVAALVAIPAIRLSGMFLALATFAFGVMVERLLYGLDSSSPPGERPQVPRPPSAPPTAATTTCAWPSSCWWRA